MSRKLGLAVAMAFAMPVACFAQATPDQQAVINSTNSVTGFAVSGMYVLIERGLNNNKVVVGTNDVDPQGQVNCASSSGCTIVVTPIIPTASSSRFITAICPIVDGIKQTLACSHKIPAIFEVTQGMHTVSTQLESSDALGRSIGAYFDTYTAYDH